MTPEEALNILYNATHNMNGTADDHAKLKECAEVLKKLIEDKKNGEKVSKKG